MTNVYFIRHARSDQNYHDDMLRPLTAEGMGDRKRVTDFLKDKNISAVISSPFKRAVDTVSDFAERSGLGIRIMNGFRERKVSDEWIDSFTEFAKKQWSDPDYRLSGGESLREVRERVIPALDLVTKEYEGKNIVIASHGTAICTIIGYYDSSFGYNDFERIKDVMPWAVLLSFEPYNKCAGIREYDFFSGGAE